MNNLQNLKFHRIQRHLTQESLAELSGISIRTIQRMEKGLSNGSPHSINALAQALQVDSME
ncbi:MAG: helix-turn-helix transcriptional regulator, partial [Bacteroidota bacterium]